MICGLLTQQYLEVNDEQVATQSNSAVRRLHEAVFGDLVGTKLPHALVFTTKTFD